MSRTAIAAAVTAVAAATALTGATAGHAVPPPSSGYIEKVYAYTAAPKPPNGAPGNARIQAHADRREVPRRRPQPPGLGRDEL